MKTLIRFLGGAILMACTAYPTLTAPKCQIDDSSPKALLKSAKACGFQITNDGIGKKIPVPQKVAIAAFQVRFDYKSQSYGLILHNSYTGMTTDMTERSYLEWEEEVYQELTDKMYDMFVQTLESQGMEVVSVEEVKSSDIYRDLKTDSASKSKKKMIRTTAYGLKNFKGSGGAMSSVAGTNKLAGLNMELGTDAVISVFATMGLVETKKSRKSAGGTKVTLGTSQGGFSAAYGGYPFSVTFLAGYKESKKPGGGFWYFPKARSSVFKAGDQMVYDESVRIRENPGFWKWNKKYSGNLEGYLRATVTLFGWASDVGLRSWNASVSK